MTTPAGAVYTHTYAFVTSPGIKKETVTSIPEPHKDHLLRQAESTRGHHKGRIRRIADHRIPNLRLPRQCRPHQRPVQGRRAQLTHGMFYDVAYTSQRLKSSNTNISAFGTTTYAYTYDRGSGGHHDDGAGW